MRLLVSSHCVTAIVPARPSPDPAPFGAPGPLAAPHQLQSAVVPVTVPAVRKPRPLPVIELRLTLALPAAASSRSKNAVLCALIDGLAPCTWIPTSLLLTRFFVITWLVPPTTMPKPSPVEPLALRWKPLTVLFSMTIPDG